jgi:ABC-type cobalamin transport system ATPase subunit
VEKVKKVMDTMSDRLKNVEDHLKKVTNQWSTDEWNKHRVHLSCRACI